MAVVRQVLVLSNTVLRDNNGAVLLLLLVRRCPGEVITTNLKIKVSKQKGDI